MATTTDYFNTAGGITWYAPKGVANVVVEGIGAGGAGANRNANGVGGGGAGGAYAKLNSFAATAGQNYTGTVGAGGNTNNNSNGGDTTFSSSTLVAKGGNTAGRNNATGQTAFAAGSSTGNTVYKGGNGVTGITSPGNNGGGGASSGGNNADGLDGVGNNGGGNGQGTLPGGAGKGGNGAKSTSAVGSNGVFPGGAGGGSTKNNATNRAGGNGANGQLKITYDYTPNAVDLDGSSQYGHIPSFTAMAALTPTMTVEGWFWNDPASGNYSAAWGFDKADASASVASIATENGTGDSGINFYWKYTGASSSDGYVSSGVFDLSTWVHIAAVFTTDAVTRIFKNGVEVSYNSQDTPTAGTATIPDSTFDFYLGHEHDPSPWPHQYWPGKVGGFFRVWNYARSSAQLLANMSLCLNSAYESGLIINCNFKEQSGTTVDNDYAPGNDMTLVGSPPWCPGPLTSDQTYGTQPRMGFVNHMNPGIA